MYMDMSYEWQEDGLRIEYTALQMVNNVREGPSVLGFDTLEYSVKEDKKGSGVK